MTERWTDPGGDSKRPQLFERAASIGGPRSTCLSAGGQPTVARPSKLSRRVYFGSQLVRDGAEIELKLGTALAGSEPLFVHDLESGSLLRSQMRAGFGHGNTSR